jgi:hypothetical protein
MKHLIRLVSFSVLSATLFTSCKKNVEEPIVNTPLQEINASEAKTSNLENNTVFTSSAAEASGEVYYGTFSVSGFITGTGTTAESVNITIPSGTGTAMMNASYTFSSTQVFTFTDGSITIKTHGKWWFTNVALLLAAGSGKWEVIASTGAYNGIKGGGTLDITSINLGVSPATVTDVYNGSLSY